MRPCAIACFSSSSASTPTSRSSARRRAGEPDQARAQDPAAPARRGDRQDARAQGAAREDSRGLARTCSRSSTRPRAKVTIKGKGIRLSEALQQLQKQTGNAITDLREQLGAEVTNPALDLEIADKPFFEALDEIARLAEVTTTYSPPATARSASWPAHRWTPRPACQRPSAKPHRSVHRARSASSSSS